MKSAAFARRVTKSTVDAREPSASAPIGRREFWILSKVRRVGLWTVLGFVGAALFFIILRAGNYDAPFTRDEGEFAYAAQLLRSGIAPYEHSFLQKPPMMIYVYALANLVAPNVFWFPRILASLAVALASGLLGWILDREFGKGYALPMVWIITPMLLLPSLTASTALAEPFMLLPLMATLAIYAGHRARLAGPGMWFFAGACGAVTLLCKYTALPLLGVIACFWAVEENRSGAKPSEVGRHLLCAVAGALAAAAAALGFFLISDGGRHLWECTVQFNRLYAASNNFGFRNLWMAVKGLWSCWQVLFLLPAILLFRRPSRAGLWVAMFIAAVLSTTGSAYGQYYILVMPFWAVLLVFGIKVLSELLVQCFHWSERWTVGGITAGTVVLLCLPGVTAMIATPDGARSVAGFSPLNPFPESILVARRIEQLTSANEYVLVAGSEPQILCYAHRLSPTRFIIAYPLMIPTRVAEQFQQEAIHDIQRRPPTVIVEAQSQTSWLAQAGTPPEFLRFLRKTLAHDYEVVGGYVLDGQNRGWREPLPAGEVFHCSLVLFRRRTESAGPPSQLKSRLHERRGFSTPLRVCAVGVQPNLP